MAMFKKLFINLLYQVSSLVIVILLIGGAIWAYAAFIEPSSAPSASNQDFAQNILGADNADNSFASTNVVANADGSIIERLEFVQGRAVGTTDIGSVTGSITGSLPEMIKYLWDNKTSFGSSAADDSPGGWTCTVRTGSGNLQATASCSGSEKVISGGCYEYETTGVWFASRPTNQGWYCRHSYSGDVTAYANCCE